MKKITIFLIIISLFLITSCNNHVDNLEENNDSIEVIDSMKVYINDSEYTLNLENNETVTNIINMLPLELTMNELNGNEFYAYLDNSLKENASIPNIISKGDVMLYGDNCLVIFYKTFKTTYSYTKIGHIDNLPDFDNSNITVKFER